MKTVMALKLTAFGILIVTIGYLLRGHDVLTGIALALLFLLVAAKVVFAIVYRGRNGPPPSGGGGHRPPDAPVRVHRVDGHLHCPQRQT